jgi:hypothetical protein
LYQSVTMIWPSGLSEGTSRKDDVVEDVPDEGRVFRREAIHQLEGHLARSDFDGVNVAGNQQNSFVRGQQLFRFGLAEVARVGEPPLGGFVALQIFHGFGRADGDRKKWISVGCLAELFQLDAGRGGRRHSHVLDDAVPSDELRVGSHAKSGELLGGRKRGRPGEAAGQQWNDEQHESFRNKCMHKASLYSSV